MRNRLMVAAVCAFTLSGCASTLEALHAFNNGYEGVQYADYDTKDVNDVTCGTSTKYGVLTTLYGIRGNQTYASFHNASNKSLSIIATFSSGAKTELTVSPGTQSDFLWKPVPVQIDEYSWGCVGSRDISRARRSRP